MALCPIPAPTESDLKRLEKYDSDVRFRGLVEMAVARRTINDLIAAGYNITVNDGDSRPVRNSADVEQIMDACFAVDDAQLILRGPGMPNAWVRFIMGNSGWDLICDHTVNLEDVLAGTHAYADELSEWF